MASPANLPTTRRGYATRAPIASTSSKIASRKLLHEKSVAGRAAWIRLFDETLAGLRFSYRGEELTNAQALDLLSSKDADARREISGVLADVLGSEIQTFALVTNTLAKDKEIEDRWRGFARPILRAQSGKPCRGRGGRCADRRGPSTPIRASLIATTRSRRAGWESRSSRFLGPQRAAARR